MKLDTVRDYHQIDVEECDIEKIVVITAFELFEYLKMPFGLKNAAQTSQRFINGFLRDTPNAYAYLDDILIASDFPAEHECDVREVLRILYKAGLNIQYSKSSVPFLEHLVSAKGISLLSERVQAITDFPKSRTIAELRLFLSMLNFYRWHLPADI